MVLICLFLCRSVSLSLFFLPPSSSAYAPILISISSIVLRLISSGLFPSRLHPLPAFQSRRVPPALALPLLFFSPSSSSQYRPASPLLLLLLLLLSGLYFSDSDVPPVANIVFLPPPLDMAKEAICALLAILEHFFEAFSPLDLFFALAPFRPVPRPFPAFLHPDCRRFPPLPIPFLHRFQPIPSPVRPLKSTSSRPGSHPSRRHPPVLSSSSGLLSLSTSVALRGRLPSPPRLSLRRLVAIARACPRLRLHVPVGLGHDGRPCRALYAVCA